MREKIKKEISEFGLLLRNVPPVTYSLFVIAVFCMNLMANKSIDLHVSWLALDCGMLMSWFAFLTLDMLTKRFGPKAATQLSIFAIIIEIILCFIFSLCAIIPGVWGEADVPGSEAVINTALNRTFSGTWYVLMGSVVAFAASAAVNNFTNWGVGKALKAADGVRAFVIRDVISTAVAQFADNLIFSFIVSYRLFDWSVVQCLTCSVTGMLVELLCEAAFFAYSYKVSEWWKKNGMGAAYLEGIGKSFDNSVLSSPEPTSETPVEPEAVPEPDSASEPEANTAEPEVTEAAEPQTPGAEDNGQ